MPSRRKKDLRDSTLTHTFFNQNASNACTCCSEHIHYYAGSSTHHTDSDSNTEMFRTVIAGLWRERYDELTAEEHKSVNAAVAEQPMVADPGSVLQGLKHAHSVLLATADQSNVMETFELSNLDEVAEVYDELVQTYANEEKRRRASLVKLLVSFASIARDATRSAGDRMAAGLFIQSSNMQGRIVLPLTFGLRQVQLFNVEKRFGFTEESYAALGYADKKRRGEDVPAELPQSFRQRMNNPFEPVGSSVKPRKKKGKKTLSALAALTELQRNCKLAIEEMRDIGNTVSDAKEQRLGLPDLKASFKYSDVPVPKDIPDRIRQRFLDAESAYQEVLTLQEVASKQLLNVRSAFVAWYSASHEVWEAGVKRIFEMPLFREYEHNRISLHAMFSMASWQEVKIVEYYKSEVAPQLPLAMNKAFRLSTMPLKEFEKDWEMRCLKLQHAFPSVDKMMSGIDKMLKEPPKADLPKTEWWKWLVGDTQ